MKRGTHVILPLVLLAGLVLGLTYTTRFVFVNPTDLTTNCITSTVPCSGRRYSTSDEMKYILYGIGDTFSLYDKQLLNYIRSHISQPSPTRPRKLASRKSERSQLRQSKLVDNLLSGRRNGFFIECGANDGETISNSLFFELQRNWTGLLIEANSKYHQTLLDKNRHAYVMNACLGTTQRPATVSFRQQEGLSRIISETRSSGANAVSVNCFPLSAITSALGISHVDYLSLDVEGPEVDILRTIDWTRLRIDVITVEYRVYCGRKPLRCINRNATLKKLNDLRELLHGSGPYREVGVMPNVTYAKGVDVVFSRL